MTMDPKIITLDPALAVGAGKIEQLVLSEPTAGQVLTAERAKTAEEGAHSNRIRDTELLALVSGVDAKALRALPVTVFREAVDYLNAFSAAPDPQATPNLDPDLIIHLDPAIQKHNRVFDVLELRPPTTGDLEAAEREIGKTFTSESLRRYQIMLVSKVSGLPRYAVEMLPISKLDEASRYLTGFI